MTTEQENLYNLLISDSDDSVLVAAELLHLFTNDEIHEILNRIRQELINSHSSLDLGKPMRPTTWWSIGRWDVTYPLYFGFYPAVYIPMENISERLKTVIQMQIKI